MTSYYIAVAQSNKLIGFIITFLLVCLLLTISFPYLIHQGFITFSELMAIGYFMFLFTVLPFVFIFGLRKTYVHEQVTISGHTITSDHLGSITASNVHKVKSYNWLGWRFTRIKMKQGSDYVFGPYQALQKEAISTYIDFVKQVHKILR